MNLTEITKLAKHAIDKRKARKTEKVYVTFLDTEFTFTSLTRQEQAEIYGAVKNGDEFEIAKKLIYTACSDLRKLAKELIEQKAIDAYEDVVDMFGDEDKAKLVTLILGMSKNPQSDLTIGGKEAEEIKN